jgi:hypothetical protein
MVSVYYRRQKRDYRCSSSKLANENEAPVSGNDYDKNVELAALFY